MTSPRTRRLAALGVAACAIGALGFWLWPGTTGQFRAAGNTRIAADAVQATQPDDGHAPGTPPAVTRNGRTGTAANVPPLPSTDLPLRDIFDELKRRADQGDPRAACRLAMELDRCSKVPNQLRMLERQTSRLPAATAGMSQEDIQLNTTRFGELTDKTLQLASHCEDVPVAPSRERMKYWRAAALGGHVPAMTHYAIGGGFQRENTLQDLAALEVYRKEAEPLARRAAAAGDPLALMALLSAYMPDPSQFLASGSLRHFAEVEPIGYLQYAVKKDLVEAMALTLLAQQAYVGDDLPGAARQRASQLAEQIKLLDTMATPGQRGQARQRMRELRAEWTPIDPRESMTGPPPPLFFPWFDGAFDICDTGRRPSWPGSR